MLGRLRERRLRESLARFPAVGLVGPRQVGKTTLARSLSGSWGPSTYLDLERPSDIAKLSDPELYLSRLASKLVIIDEVQRRPDLFPILRSLIDDAPDVMGRFLLLGSASPDLIRDSSESLAGRIRYVTLDPLCWSEVNDDQRELSHSIDRLWIRGGFPSSYLAPTEEASADWREGLVATYLEQDLRDLGVRIPSTQLRRFWTMLAHNHGQTWNASKLATSLGVSAPTVRRHLDLLESTFMVRQLSPYFANVKKRLVKAPKIYLRDSGLLHVLLRLRDLEDVLAAPIAGASWEGFVIEELSRLLPETPLHFYRTSGGAELDLVLLPRRGPPIGCEIKRTLSPAVGRGMRSALDDLKADRAFVFYPGSERYPLQSGIEAIPVTQIPAVAQELAT